MIKSKDEALSSLPRNPIQTSDKVFPARIILNILIDNQTYLLKNTNSFNTDKVLDNTANWNTLEPQTTFQFNGLGTGAPDSDVLATDHGIVITLGTNESNNPILVQIVITDQGLAYRIIGQDWSYLGHQVPNNIDADNLIDKEHLYNILTDQLSNYVTANDYKQDKDASTSNFAKNAQSIDSLSSSLSAVSSFESMDTSSLSSWNSSQSNSVTAQLAKNSADIESNYNSLSGYEDSTSNLDSEVNGSVSANGLRYYGVFGSNGLSSVASENQSRLDSSSNSMISLKGSLADMTSITLSMYGSYNDAISANQSQITSMSTTSSEEDLKDSVSNNSSEINSINSSLAPLAMQNAQLLDSIATTTYTNSYAEINIGSAQSLSVSSTPSNFAPIMSDVFVESGVPYEFKANVAIKSEDVSTEDGIPAYNDITGTIGFSSQHEAGITYQVMNNTSDDMPIPPGNYQDNAPQKNRIHEAWAEGSSTPLSKTSNDSFVQITYPYTNLDIDSQLNDHIVDIIFIPLANEKLNIIAIPAQTDLEPSTYNDVQLIEHKPITQSSNTNSLLSATINSMSDIANQYQQETSINNSNIILNNQIANNAMSGASQATSYLASTPRVSLAPTYSYANSCSTNNPAYVYLYPQYDNVKEEKALDWCLTEITPTNVKVYGNWDSNTPTKDLVNQVKSLTAGIIGNIEAVEEMLGGAVADPQNPDKIQDWTQENYLQWSFTQDEDTSSILNYLNTTLKRTPAQEWNGWEAYLGLHGRADVCANWLSSQLQNNASDAGYYAMKVRSLLY